MSTPAVNYRPTHLEQRDTGSCQWQNCNCASHAMLVDLDWLGARKISVHTVRNEIAAIYGAGCYGTSMSQNRTAIARLANTNVSYRWDVPFQNAMDALDSGHAVVALEDYSGWHGTPWDYSYLFNGLHAVLYLPQRRYNTNLRTPRWERLRGDPLGHGFEWVPESKVRETMRDGLSDRNVEFQFSRGLRPTYPKKVLYAVDKDGKTPGYRTSPGGGTRLATAHRGDTLVHSGYVTGRTVHVNRIADNGWLRITEINGRTARQHFGHSVVYVSRGWFRGPTGAV